MRRRAEVDRHQNSGWNCADSMCFGHDGFLAEPLWWPASLLIRHPSNLARYNLCTLAHTTGSMYRAMAGGFRLDPRYTHSRSHRHAFSIGSLSLVWATPADRQ
jgi:hypothetical protein